MFSLKMHSFAVFLFINLFVLTSSHNINYCGSKMCGYTNAHTLCQFSFGPSPSCTGLIPVPLTPDEKSRILLRLNQRRNDAASGRLRGLPSAGNMLKLRWVEELAKEAQMWADQCRPPRTPEENDACRDLYSISVGQCVASVVGESPGLHVESMVDIWFMQNIYYKGNVTLYEPPDPSKYFYGDFAQIIWARTFLVGCGRSRFMLPVRGRFRTIERLVCNFAPQGPVPNRPMWSLGIPASSCPSRSRPYDVLTSLCDYKYELNKQNDIDDSMTLEEHILLNSVLEIERNETQFGGSVDEIYLTYLAIVTMQNIDVTSPRSNSMQKRDIVEKITVKNDIGNTNNNKISEFAIETQTQTTQNVATEFLKKKLKIIGRPKAYNMDELSDTDGDQKEENHYLNEAISKHKKDFYSDYNIHEEIPEDNVTLTTDQFKPEDLNENDSLENNSYLIAEQKSQTPLGTAVTIMDHTILYTVTKEHKINETSQTLPIINTDTTNESQAAKDTTMEDYLSDPETVRQLQAALDRMEHEAAKTSGSSMKIRREISDSMTSPTEPNSESNDSSLASDAAVVNEVEVATGIPKESENETALFNTGLSNDNPVLNSMLKLMPYLKQQTEELSNKPNYVCHLVGDARLCFMLFLTLFIL